MSRIGTILHSDHEDSGLQIARLGYDPYKGPNTRMANEMMRVMLDHYPGYGWSVTADMEQQICSVSLPALMGPTIKYVIKMNEIATSNDFEKKLKQAGGELLERFRLSRRGLFMPEYSDVRRARPHGRFMTLRTMPE